MTGEIAAENSALPSQDYLTYMQKEKVHIHSNNRSQYYVF